MRIGIDCFAMQDPASAERGIGRYARDLTRAIIKAAPDDEFVLYTIDAYDTGRIPHAGNAWTRLIPATGRTNRFTSRALDSWVYGNPDDLDALLILSPLQSHVEPPCGVPRVLSVFYDLIPEVLPNEDFQEPTYREAYETYLEVIRGYDAILTMSEHARVDLIRRRHFPPGKILCAGADASPHFCPTPACGSAEDWRLLNDCGIFAPGYVLNVGHEDPRKGSRVLAEAFGMLPEDLRSQTRLVYAYNASGSHQQEIRSCTATFLMPGACGDSELQHDLGLSPAVHFTGWCDDATLRALYRNAAVMVFPSLYEGFGLPILEAMRCGCPVIAGDNSSQTEVVGEAGLLVDPGDQEGLSILLAQLLQNRKRARWLSKLGLARSACYSWPKVAARALGAIRGEFLTLEQ